MPLKIASRKNGAPGVQLSNSVPPNFVSSRIPAPPERLYIPAIVPLSRDRAYKYGQRVASITPMTRLLLNVLHHEFEGKYSGTYALEFRGVCIVICSKALVSLTEFGSLPSPAVGSNAAVSSPSTGPT